MVKRSGLILLVLMLMGIISAYGQNERKVIRDGVRAYENEEFGEAEVQFRKAENINQESYEAEFNTGAALYGQEKYEETVKQYQSLLDHTDDAGKTARIWHNIGNSLLEAQQYAPSIEAYKNSLRLNPSDEDTRYNLAYAKQKLNEQQQQNQDQEQDKDQEQQDQEQDKDKDQEQNIDQDQDQGDDQQDRQDQQPVPQEISKEDAERMLKAIQQQEKDVKEKVDKKKAAAAKVKTEKDW
ncbi:MAG: tetratricopeptide repeat protein [Bacteroidales bacterium]|nr:tetratricopeptide repeat protein [Bacteroidales bacterium]